MKETYQTIEEAFRIKTRKSLTDKILSCLGKMKLKCSSSCCKSKCSLNEEKIVDK
jgi:hypothetical protein